MLSTIEAVNSVVNNFIWGVPAMICIIGVGLYLSIRTRFLQIRKFPYSMKVTLGRMMKKKEASDGALTPFQAVCTALAATVGTGNVAGVAGAIAIGGPGAVFWMWISALLGMCTKFAEVTLAVHFRETNAQGDLVGGPMYYIKNGLDKKWHFLAYLFAAFGVLAVFGTGNATQVNTITTAIDSALSSFNVLPADAVKLVNLIIGVALAIIIALILIGGIKRIGNVTSKLVPFMAIMYIVLALGVIIFHIKSVPAVFASIIEGAFNPASVTGGVVGSFFMSMKKGVSRGIFSNEAGLGTGSIAHACADTKKPVKQGFFGIFEVFVDTIIICTMTALVILCSGVPVNYGEAAGAELTISGFTAVYGNWVSIFTAVAMCCFAFSTIIGWGLYGTRCIEFLFGSRSNKPFMVLYSLTAIVGATMNLGLMWSIAETFNGLMVIPNLIAVFLLSGVVVKMTKEYFAKENG
jgi:AGCS family alanine or glycine:cation symporter